jgi:hypothetical protein
LAKAFSDPIFAKAASEVAKDPERAFAKYMQQRPDLMEALQEFCKLLGKEMEVLASSKDSATSATTTPQIPDDLPDHEKELVRRVLANPEIQASLIFVVIL